MTRLINNSFYFLLLLSFTVSVSSCSQKRKKLLVSNLFNNDDEINSLDIVETDNTVEKGNFKISLSTNNFLSTDSLVSVLVSNNNETYETPIETSIKHNCSGAICKISLDIEANTDSNYFKILVNKAGVKVEKLSISYEDEPQFSGSCKNTNISRMLNINGSQVFVNLLSSFCSVN